MVTPLDFVHRFKKENNFTGMRGLKFNNDFVHRPKR